MRTTLKKISILFVFLLSYQLFSNSLDNSNHCSIVNAAMANLDDCPPEEVDGLLVFEAERFVLQGAWKIGEDAEKASGGKYIFFDGPNSYQNANPASNISYTFKINNPGTYSLKWMMRQPEGERGTDLGNDAWIYFSDDIARGNGGIVLDKFYKFVGRSTDDFTLNGAAEIDHASSGVNVIFSAAGEYTLNLRGRSHHFELDRIILSKGINVNDLPSKIALIAETNTCEEDDDNPTGEEVDLVNPFTTFDDSILEVPIKFSYTAVEERTITVDIAELNGNVIKSSSVQVDAGTGETDITITLDETLLWGETLKIVTSLKSNTGAIIRKAENSFSVTADPSLNSVTIIDYPKIISETRNVVKVKYDITKTRDLLLQLRKNQWTIKTIRINVPKGKLERDITIDLGTLPGDGRGFFWRAMARVKQAPFRGNLHTHDVENIEIDKDYLSVDDISGKQKVKISTYPNPFIDSFTVKLPSDNTFEKLEVLDLMGKTILSKDVIGDSTFDLDIKVAQGGIYLLKLTGPKTYSIQTLIKK